MGRTRGKANQSLYRARILLAAWETQREAEAYPQDRLLEAFLPAVRLHLRDCYGWFLLSVSGVEESAVDAPPGRVADLPEPAVGKMKAPELTEFAALETSGWLADMLRGPVAGDAAIGVVNKPAGPSSGSALLGSDRQLPGPAVAASWASALAEIMARMDDSLAEC